MNVNKQAVRLNILDCIKLGIKRHFKSAKFTDEVPELGLLKVEVIGVHLDIHVRINGKGKK